MIAVGDSVWLGGIISVVVIVAIILGRNISGKLGGLSVTVNAVNRAVNDRPPGAPTISDQMATTAAKVEDIHAAVESLAHTTSRGIAGLNNAVDSLDKRLAALAVRVAALEVAGTPPTQPPVQVNVNPASAA